MAADAQQDSLQHAREEADWMSSPTAEIRDFKTQLQKVSELTSSIQIIFDSFPSSLSPCPQPWTVFEELVAAM